MLLVAFAGISVVQVRFEQMQKREKKRALLIELVEIELMYLLRRVDVEIAAGEGSIYHTSRKDIDWHLTSLYDRL